MTRFSVFLLLIASFSAAAGQLLFKLGAQGHARLVEFANVQIVLGLFFYLVGTAIWVYVLSTERLTEVYAFTALTFVLVYVAGVFVVGEKLITSTVIGIGLILVGLYLIVAKPAIV